MLIIPPDSELASFFGRQSWRWGGGGVGGSGGGGRDYLESSLKSGGGKVFANISVPCPLVSPFPTPQSHPCWFQKPNTQRKNEPGGKGGLASTPLGGQGTGLRRRPICDSASSPRAPPGFALERSGQAAAELGPSLAALLITTSAVCSRETGRVLLWLAAFLWHKHQARPISSLHSKSRKMNCNSPGPEN